MCKNYFFLIFIVFSMVACTNSSKKSIISPQAMDQVIAKLSEQENVNKTLIDKGVYQVARLWQETDGSEGDFIQYCLDHYISNPAEKQKVFLKISGYLEDIGGHFNEMTLRLRQNVDENTGPLHPVDEIFAAYNPATHFSDDFYANKLAFFIALNFPQMSLEEKEALGNDRLAWAYARLGDQFTYRIPAAIQQAYSQANSDANIYISTYNIYAGHLLNKNGEKKFPEDMILPSHWNLRDEIKTNYNKGAEGLDKQQTIYEAMKRIISQEIPKEIINSDDYDWNPFSNTLYQAGKSITGTPEETVRYEKFMNNFKTLQAMDVYTGNTYIERNFSEDMEISVEDAETLFRKYLSAPELKTVAQIVEKKLGRKLEAFDIWYDGFKLRSNLNEDKLSEQIRKQYPDAAAIEKQLPVILIQLGFSRERAEYITDKIEVDAARGSGHAWGAAMKGQKSHLRTRIPAGGTDYKGYNIAMHELGHTVEQTLSLYDVDYFLLSGVPNTAFTEALAFVFQKRDLDLLGIKDKNPEKATMAVLDEAWQLYEIAGVSMLDIAVWKWLYAHPKASPEQLKAATLQLAKDVWNEYFAPVFGIRDEPVLAIYSHMVNYPLYLSAYTFGQIIQFQLEQYLAGKDFAREVDRIFRLGRLTPNQWMIAATGQPLSVKPLLKALRELP
jgi:ribosomal protein S13